jgi:hypothetical protein
MINLNNNSNPQLSSDVLKKIHSIKSIIIYTSSHTEKITEQFNELLIKYCGIYSCDEFEPRNYSLYISSGNDESNKNLIYGAISSFRKITKNKPHILICETDNSSLLNYINQLKINNDADIELIPINVQGNTITKIIEKSIKPNKTCLLIIGFVNHIFGSVNNIKKIGELCHQHKIPMHVNCNYIFGNYKIDPYENNIDSFVFDLSSLGVSSNFGILGIKKQLIEGYQLDKSIPELSINNKNKIDPIILQIANNTISTIYTNSKNRITKQKKIRIQLLKELEKKFNILTLMDWIKNPNTQISDKKTIIILYIGDENIICANTLSLIPINFTELEHKKISDTIKYDEISKNIIEYYKTIFSDLFKKNDKDINIFNNIYTLSWNDKINAKQINKFINCLM